ncbi:hypothetical protein VNO77_19090 [Canavalia gladiata]|uniref:Uncharacterized protein n=1 Tax=Canavalia gladiata TaxID=3824 RepID=A0AAN9QK74_CANGL
MAGTAKKEPGNPNEVDLRSRKQQSVAYTLRRSFRRLHEMVHCSLHIHVEWMQSACYCIAMISNEPEFHHPLTILPRQVLVLNNAICIIVLDRRLCNQKIRPALREHHKIRFQLHYQEPSTEDQETVSSIFGKMTKVDGHKEIWYSGIGHHELDSQSCRSAQELKCSHQVLNGSLLIMRKFLPGIAARYRQLARSTLVARMLLKVNTWQVATIRYMGFESVNNTGKRCSSHAIPMSRKITPGMVERLETLPTHPELGFHPARAWVPSCHPELGFHPAGSLFFE